MDEEEIIEAARRTRPFVRTSVILDRLAVELEAGCTHSGSLQFNAAGKIEARGLKPLWDMTNQKVLILDGTANSAELRKILPALEEIRVDVERNAYFIKIRDTVFAKSTCLKWDDSQKRYVPT